MRALALCMLMPLAHRYVLPGARVMVCVCVVSPLSCCAAHLCRACAASADTDLCAPTTPPPPLSRCGLPLRHPLACPAPRCLARRLQFSRSAHDAARCHPAPRPRATTFAVAEGARRPGHRRPQVRGRTVAHAGRGRARPCPSAAAARRWELRCVRRKARQRRRVVPANGRNGQGFRPAGAHCAGYGAARAAAWDGGSAEAASRLPCGRDPQQVCIVWYNAGIVSALNVVQGGFISIFLFTGPSTPRCASKKTPP